MEHRENDNEAWSAIRGVLMSTWDPIGIRDVPQAADEYDSYIDGILSLLRYGATDLELTRHLREIETERMGLTNALGLPLVPAGERAGAVKALQRLDIIAK